VLSRNRVGPDALIIFGSFTTSAHVPRLRQRFQWSMINLVRLLPVEPRRKPRAAEMSAADTVEPFAGRLTPKARASHIWTRFC
jgi:hypothetical protein